MKNLFSTFCLLALLTACQPAIPPTRTIAPTTLGVTATATTPMLTSVSTANIKPTASPLPDRPLSTSGPWVFVPLNKTFFAINPDGTGYTSFNRSGPKNVVAIATYGNRVAYVEKDTYDDVGAVLTLRSLLGDAPIVIPLATSLKESAFTGDDFEPNGNSYPKSAYDKYIETATAIGELAWSPNGKYLAFTGAIDGPTSDVYVYSLATGKIKRLTDSITQAVRLEWTPDSHYIVHAAATSLNVGRSGGGYDLDSFWAVTPDGTETKKIASLSSDAEILGWLDSSKYIVGYFYSYTSPYFALDIVDINTGKTTNWFDDSFVTGSYAPIDKVFLLSVDKVITGTQKYADGLYLLRPGKTPEKISDIKAKQFAGIAWYPEIKRFLVADYSGKVYLVTADGRVETIPSLSTINDLTISPDGKYWSTFDGGIEVGDFEGHVWKNISSAGDVWCQIWSADSHYCYVLTNESFMILAAPDFKTLREIPRGSDRGGWLAPVWVSP